MTRISLPSSSGGACQGPRSNVVLPKGPVDVFLRLTETVGECTFPLQGLQDVGPQCGVPGGTRQEDGTLASDGGLPLPGHVRKERRAAADSPQSLLVCCPDMLPGSDNAPDNDSRQADSKEGLIEGAVSVVGPARCSRDPDPVAGGGKEPAGNDSRQADSEEGLIEGAVSMVGFARCSCDPDPVADGGKEPARDDSGQVGGREGLTADTDKFSLDCEGRALYTGRFHVLTQQEPPDLPEGDFFDAAGAPTASPQACAADEEAEMLHDTLPASFAPGTSLCTLRGGGRRHAADMERQRGAGVWSSSSSESQGPVQQALEDSVSIPISTWNLAGAGKKKVKGIITTVFEHDIVAVQEYPKQTAGWRAVDHGRMSAILYQDTMMYRAVGVMYDKHKFRCRKRKWSNRGVWVLLEHLEGSRELWIGSLHLPVNEVIEEIYRFIDEFMAALPVTHLPAVMLGDMNTHFKWRVRERVCADCPPLCPRC